jgi:hypothetical protein
VASVHGDWVLARRENVWATASGDYEQRQSDNCLPHESTSRFGCHLSSRFGWVDRIPTIGQGHRFISHTTPYLGREVGKIWAFREVSQNL